MFAGRVGSERKREEEEEEEERGEKSVQMQFVADRANRWSDRRRRTNLESLPQCMA